MRTFEKTLSGVVLAAVMMAPPMSAQSAPKPGVPDSATVRANKKLFTGRDAIMAGGFAATTILFFPLDRYLATQMQDPSPQANQFFQDAATGVELIASPGAYYIGTALYVSGKALGSRRLADLGWHGTEAVLVGEGISMLMKGLLGRQRPIVSTETPRDFGFGRGFTNGDWRSFPSGHTTTAFAAASAVTDETMLWWPKSKWVVGPIMYGGATLVGVSRMYHNRHWASDVAVGALIGTFSGKKVVLASHSNPKNVIDRFMLGTYVAPSKFAAWNIGWGTSW